MAVRPDGSFEVTETIAVDFGDLTRHGIFRDLPIRFPVPSDPLVQRVVTIDVLSATDGDGADIPFSATEESTVMLVMIGDPNVTITGKNTFVLTYTVGGSLTPSAGHDELAWNVTGDQWPIPMNAATATVTLPSGATTSPTCFVGPAGSTDPCAMARIAGSTVTFEAGRALGPGEGMTIAVEFPKGIAAVAPPVTEPVD